LLVLISSSQVQYVGSGGREVIDVDTEEPFKGADDKDTEE